METPPSQHRPTSDRSGPVSGLASEEKLHAAEPSQTACPLPKHNASPEEIRLVLYQARTVAVVGLSDKPQRESHRVANYLKQQGYRVIPVNPNVTEVLGERAYASLKDVPEPVDVVDVFRRPDAVPEVVEQAIEVGAKAVWLQVGVVHDEAAQRARQAGLTVVQNRCMMQEHQRLLAEGGCPERSR